MSWFRRKPEVKPEPIYVEKHGSYERWWQCCNGHLAWVHLPAVCRECGAEQFTPKTARVVYVVEQDKRAYEGKFLRYEFLEHDPCKKDQ